MRRTLLIRCVALVVLWLVPSLPSHAQTLTSEQRRWAARVGAAALKTDNGALLTAIDSLAAINASSVSAASRTFDEFVRRYTSAVDEARRVAPGRTELESLTQGLQHVVAQTDAETRKRLEPFVVQGYAQLAQRAIEAALPLSVRGNAINDRYYYDVLIRAAQAKERRPDIARAIESAVDPILDGLDQKMRDRLDELQKTIETVEDLPAGFRKALEEIDGLIGSETSGLGAPVATASNDFKATVDDARALLFTASVLLGRFGDKASRDVLTLGTIGLQIATYVNQARMGQISNTVMTANVVGAVVMIFTLSASSEPPEAQLMTALQEAVGRLDRNIAELRKQVLAVGKAMLESLDAVYRDVSAQLRLIQKDTRYIAESIDVLDARVAELDAKVTYFYGTYRSTEQQASLEQLIRTIRACERRVESESRSGRLSLEAEQCFDDLKLTAESTAKGPIWTNSVQVLTASDASLYSLLLQRPVAENIGLVVGLAGKLSGVDRPPFVSSTFVNPSVWRAAAAAYVRLASASPAGTSHTSELSKIGQEGRRLQDLSESIRTSPDAAAMWKGLAEDLDTQIKALAGRIRDFRIEYETKVLNGVSVRTALKPSGGRPAEEEIAALFQPTVKVTSAGSDKPEERRDVLPPNMFQIVPDDIAVAAVRRRMRLEVSMARSWAAQRTVTPAGLVQYQRGKLAVEYLVHARAPGSDSATAILKGSWTSSNEVAFSKNCSYGTDPTRNVSMSDLLTVNYCNQFSPPTFDHAFAEEWQKSPEMFDARKLQAERQSGIEALPSSLAEERRGLSDSAKRYFETLRSALEGGMTGALSPAIVDGLQETYRRAVLSARVLEGMSLLGDMSPEFRSVVTLAQPTRLLTVLRTGTSESQGEAFESSLDRQPLPGVGDVEWPVREVVSGDELRRLPDIASATAAAQVGSQATGVDEVSALLSGWSGLGASTYKASVAPEGGRRYRDAGETALWLATMALVAAALACAAWWFKGRLPRTR